MVLGAELPVVHNSVHASDGWVDVVVEKIIGFVNKYGDFGHAFLQTSTSSPT